MDEVTGGLRFTASLDFRTTQCSGLLLYTASPSQPDHLGLELVDGVVGFSGRCAAVHRLNCLPPSVPPSLLPSSLPSPPHPQMRFIFDNGRRPSVVEYFPPDLASLCDDQWHSVHLVKDRMTGTLSIDGADPVVEVSDTDFVSLQLNSPLFVGGVPGKISAN